MRIDALISLRSVIENHSPSIARNFQSRIFVILRSTCLESSHRVNAEALRGIRAFVDVIRTEEEASRRYYHEDVSSLIESLITIISPKLTTFDIDQEVKEASLMAAAKLLNRCGDNLYDISGNLLLQFCGRLDNELTRIPALRAIDLASSSLFPLEYGSMFPSYVKIICGYLRQQSRHLRQCALETLDLLVKKASQYFDNELITLVLMESTVLIDHDDVVLVHMSLQVIFDAFSSCENFDIRLFEALVPKLLEMSISPVLQGQSLQRLVSIFTILPKFSYIASDLQVDRIVSSLFKHAISNPVFKQTFVSFASCVAGALSAADSHLHVDIIQALLQKLHDSSSDNEKLCVLYSLREIGKGEDLAHIAGISDLVLSCFNSPLEDIKVAAAVAFGSIAVGNVSIFLPMILGKLKSSESVYLSFISLKEILSIFVVRKVGLSQLCEQLQEPILSHACASEESVRNAVSECLGLLLLLNSGVFSWVMTLSCDASPFSRWTSVSAVRYALMRRDIETPVLIFENIDVIFGLLIDDDLEVRKMALMMTNVAFFYHPHDMESRLKHICDVILEALGFKREIVVDLGPFKHKVDEYFLSIASLLLIYD